MRKGLVWSGAILAAVLAAVSCTTMTAQPPMTPRDDALRVATYNVHYIILANETGPWSVADWHDRKGPMDQAFKAIDADVIGFQEMESFGGPSGSQENLTLDWLLAKNPDYAAAAVGDPDFFPSTQPVLYRKSRLELVDQDWFFFSDTPDVIYARTFNGSYPAFASLATFIDKPTGQAVHFVNVHFEFKSRSNRVQSAELVVNRVQAVLDAGEKVVFIGDINARHGARTQDILAAAGWDFLPVKGATYHLNSGVHLFGAIDHIALSDGLSVVGAPHVLRQKFDGRWPSDHYPVVADIVID